MCDFNQLTALLESDPKAWNLEESGDPRSFTESLEFLARGWTTVRAR